MTAVWGFLKRYGRWLLLAAGVVAVVALIREAGVDAVAAALWSARWFLVPIFALEIGFFAMDVFALRDLYGPERAAAVPLAAWVRSAMTAYGWMILLPAGRAGGETARAVSLAPWVGGARSAAGAAHLQSVTMMANSAISIPCWIAVAATVGPGHVLAWLIAGNALLTAVIGGVLMLGARNSRLGGWLGRRLTKIRFLAQHGDSLDDALRTHRGFPWRPLAYCTAGRLLQTLQYGVVVVAVGGAAGIGTAFVAEGIHLVAAGVGDMVPNQAGISEAAYRFAASALGLAPAQGLAVALVIRVCQVSLGSLALAVGALWRGRRAVGPAEDLPGAGAEAARDRAA